MDDEKILYQFEIPYPWKKLIRGGFLVTSPIFFLSIVFGWYQFIFKPPSPDYFVAALIVALTGVLYIGLNLLMRYALIHADKIKEPIKVWATPYEVHFRKGNIKKDFSIEYLKTARVALTDKIVMLETNYEKDEDWKKGWKVAFKRNNELQDTDYREFINETFLPFTEIVIDRLKEINPDIRITRTDERRKYR